MKKAIVSCLFGGYDTLLQAPNYNGWTPILFTDSTPHDGKGWEIRLVDPSNDPQKQSRYYKIMLHEVLPEYDFYCYLDANISLLKEPPSTPIWATHPSKRNLWQEARAIVSLGKEESAVVNRQMVYYKNARVRGNVVIPANGFFCRNNNDLMNKICDLWYSQVKQFSYRDQLGLTYAMEFYNSSVEGLTIYNQVKPYFNITNPHIVIKNKPRVQVHHITAGRSDKNIGKAINDLVKGLPDSDWICLRDIDTMPMNHVDFFNQCEEIANNGGFELVSCMTNRIGIEDQQHNGIISDDPNIENHIKIGKELFEAHGSSVVRTFKTLAGVMLLFPKSIWTKVGGFDEGGIVDLNNHFHDYNFSIKVKRAGGSLGIAKGIYLFHLYRWGFDHPHKHLY